MDIGVAIWLVFSAFILGAHTGTPGGASTGMENPIATSEAQPSTEADADLADGESAPEPLCSMGPHGRIYRDLTRPHVRRRE